VPETIVELQNPFASRYDSVKQVEKKKMMLKNLDDERMELITEEQQHPGH
jgi:hypothetical protein